MVSSRHIASALALTIVFMTMAGVPAFGQSKGGSDGYTKRPDADEISLISGGSGKSGGSSSSSSSSSSAKVDFKDTDNGESAIKLVKSIWRPMFNLLRIVMGIGALIAIVILVFNIMGGKPESARKLAWWFAGLTLGFILLSILQGLLT